MLLQYFLIKNYLVEMSLEREEQESVGQLPEQELKICHQNTTKCANGTLSPTEPAFDFDSLIQSSTDTSFEFTMHQENMSHIKAAADRYLEECLVSSSLHAQGFKDPSLYRVKPIQFTGDNYLDSIITHNEHLKKKMILEIREMLEKEDGLIGLLKQVPIAFGLTVAKELVYVIYHILHQKIEKFHQLIRSKEPLIPKMQCLQDFCDDLLPCLATSCPVYEEINLEEVICFAENDIESIANQIYFSDLKILTLRDISYQCKKGIKVIDKFSKFVKQISKSVFLTIVGATEPSLGIFGMDLSREISYAELSEPGFSMQKSLSRPFVPYDDEESCDFVSKKIKFQ